MARNARLASKKHVVSGAEPHSNYNLTPQKMTDKNKAEKIGNPYAYIDVEKEEAFAKRNYTSCAESRGQTVSGVGQLELPFSNTGSSAQIPRKIPILTGYLSFHPPGGNQYAGLSSMESIEEEESYEANSIVAMSLFSDREMRGCIRAFLESYSPTTKLGGRLSDVRRGLITRALKISKEKRGYFIRELNKLQLPRLEGHEYCFQRDQRSGDDQLIEKLNKLVDEFL